jgi:hypothetical protein
VRHYTHGQDPPCPRDIPSLSSSSSCPLGGGGLCGRGTEWRPSRRRGQ